MKEEKEQRLKQDLERAKDEAMRRIPSIDQFGRAYATGYRKTATARVWVSKGTGQVTVNRKMMVDYFKRIPCAMRFTVPCKLSEAPSPTTCGPLPAAADCRRKLEPFGWGWLVRCRHLIRSTGPSSRSTGCSLKTIVRWSARSPASPRRARTSNGSNGKLSALRGSVPTGAAGTGKAPAGAQHRTQQGPPTHFCVTCFGSTFSKVRLAVMVALLLAVAALWPLVAVKRQTCACLRVGTSLEAHELECWTKGAVASGSKWKGAGLERRGGAPGRRPIRCGEGGGWRRRGPH